MAGDLPAVGFQAGSDILRHFDLPGVGTLAQLVLPVGVGVVAEHTLAARHGYDALCAAIGKVRVFLDEALQNRHQVVVALALLAVVADVIAGEAPVGIHRQPVGKTVAAGVCQTVAVTVDHGGIIVHVVLHDDQQLFPGGQIDLALFIGLLAVVVHLGGKQVVRPDQHIAALVEFFQDGFEFLDRYMILVVGFGILVPVKGTFRVCNQTAEAEEGHLSGVRHLFQGGLGRLIAGLCL